MILSISFHAHRIPNIAIGMLTFLFPSPARFWPQDEHREESEDQKVAPTEVTAEVPLPPPAEPPSDQDG